MANVNNPNGFKARMNLSGGAIPILTGMSVANTAFAPGDAIIVATTGLLTIALAASATILGVCVAKITAESGVSKPVPYVPALPTIVFSGQCSGTPTQTMFGELIDIEGGTGVMQLNEDASSTDIARVIGLDQDVNNSLGANARLLFTFNKSEFTT